jgi:hypothetical protein
MRRLPLILFAVLAFAGGAAAFFLFRENRALRAELAAARGTITSASAVQATPAAVAAPAPSATDAVQVSAAVPTISEAAVEGAPARPRASTRREGDRRDRGQEFFARALADPESRAAMLSRAKSPVDRMFGDYFVKQGLNETQIEALRTLLAERQLARMESGMLERSAETDQERADAKTWRESKLATTEADINSILGADGLKNLQAYLDSAPQRQVVDDIARRANYSGAPLSSEVSDQLVEAVRQASADVPLPRLPGTGRWNGGDDSNTARQPLTAETASAYLQDLRTRNQQIIERARGFLTQPQLEALADQQIDEMQQAEAQLNFMLRNPDARGPGRGFGGGDGGRGPGGGGRGAGG